MLACSVLTPGPGETTQFVTALIVGILSGTAMTCTCPVHTSVLPWTLSGTLHEGRLYIDLFDHGACAAASFACGSFSRGGLYCVHQVSCTSCDLV